MTRQDLSAYTERSDQSGIIYLTPLAQEISPTGFHHYMYHHLDSDVRDIYRALHKAAVKVYERAGCENPHEDGVGLYADALGDGRVKITIVSVDQDVICEAVLTPYQAG